MYEQSLGPFIPFAETPVVPDAGNGNPQLPLAPPELAPTVSGFLETPVLTPPELPSPAENPGGVIPPRLHSEVGAVSLRFLVGPYNKFKLRSVPKKRRELNAQARVVNENIDRLQQDAPVFRDAFASALETRPSRPEVAPESRKQVRAHEKAWRTKKKKLEAGWAQEKKAVIYGETFGYENGSVTVNNDMGTPEYYDRVASTRMTPDQRKGHLRASTQYEDYNRVIDRQQRRLIDGANGNDRTGRKISSRLEKEFTRANKIERKLVRLSEVEAARHQNLREVQEDKRKAREQQRVRQQAKADRREANRRGVV